MEDKQEIKEPEKQKPVDPMLELRKLEEGYDGDYSTPRQRMNLQRFMRRGWKGLKK